MGRCIQWVCHHWRWKTGWLMIPENITTEMIVLEFTYKWRIFSNNFWWWFMCQSMNLVKNDGKCNQYRMFYLKTSPTYYNSSRSGYRNILSLLPLNLVYSKVESRSKPPFSSYGDPTQAKRLSQTDSWVQNRQQNLTHQIQFSTTEALYAHLDHMSGELLGGCE